MTTKTYQAQLPLRNHRIVTPRPMPRPLLPPAQPSHSEMAMKLKRFIEEAVNQGFWYCNDCHCSCERIEGEQGQPAHCHRCKGHRLVYNPPMEIALQQEAV
jgi:hypothetical protein